MKKTIKAKVKKYQGYATFLSGKLRRKNSAKLKGALLVVQGKVLEVL